MGEKRRGGAEEKIIIEKFNRLTSAELAAVYWGAALGCRGRILCSRNTHD